MSVPSPSTAVPTRASVVITTYMLAGLVTLVLGVGGVAYNIGYVVQESRAVPPHQYWERFRELMWTTDFVVGMLLSIFPIFFGCAILVLAWIEYREWNALQRAEAAP